ncbi:MAG: phosphatase PAP2 family protein [Tissierellia bacterium]|nr:phosphatase PAP2 family protein [Tissierellia bacterium]
MRKNNKLTILTIVSIILLIVIGMNIRASEEGILFDEGVMKFVHERTSHFGMKIMQMITFFGSSKFFLAFGFILLLLMFRRKNLEGMFLVITSIVGSYGINFILKHLFIRTRPINYFLIEQGGYSFPSGHAMVSMSFYTTMTYWAIKNNGGNKKILRLFNFIIVALIGYSRIYLGVHWPTDILMGYLLGYVVYRWSTNFLIEG